MAIGSDGLGVISYSDVPADPAAPSSLKVAHCQDLACSSATLGFVDTAPPHTSLVIFGEDAPDPVRTLQTFTYRWWVDNNGPLAPTQVTVQQTLPAGVTFQSADGDGWACGEAGGTVTCTRAGIPVYARTPDLFVRVTTPVTAQTLTSTATVSSNLIDPRQNQWTVATEVRWTVVDLVASMDDGGATARWGQPFTWTVGVWNAWYDDASGALVTDNFPPGVTGVTWTCTATAGSSCPATGSGNISVPVTLLPDGRATFVATGTVGAGTLSLVNTVTAAVPPGAIDRVPISNSATVKSAVHIEPMQAYLVAPCRVVDTRTSEPPALDAGGSREFAVAGKCNVPADARAVAVNATAVNPGDMGNLRLYPAGTGLPLTSVVNFAAGHTRANNAVVALGPGGGVSVQCDMPPGSTATTHFVLDVTAYFK